MAQKACWTLPWPAADDLFVLFLPSLKYGYSANKVRFRSERNWFYQQLSIATVPGFYLSSFSSWVSAGGGIDQEFRELDVNTIDDVSSFLDLDFESVDSQISEQLECIPSKFFWK